MPRLVPPDLAQRATFVDALAEYHGDGLHLDLNPDRLRDEATFSAYVSALGADALPEFPRPAGYVPQTMLWWVDGDEYLARLSIRHRFAGTLRWVGGHIGYDVRPSARRRGHATAMLAAALPIAAQLGVDPALVTCDYDNIASRRVIEANGGRFEGASHGKFRYWVSA